MIVQQTLLSEGKTKKIFDAGGDLALIESKDDLTAGDGAKHDVVPDKGIWSTATTCNVFQLLKAWGLPVAYLERRGQRTFLAQACAMVPYEVVARRRGIGSYAKRHPDNSPASRFGSPVIEFYLKTQGKRWGDLVLTKDDPLVEFVAGDDGPSAAALFRPDLPLETQLPMHVLDDFPLKQTPDHLSQIERLTRQIFLILEAAWGRLEHELVDLKVEFGFTADGRLVVADVIDNDSWRLLNKQGQHLDKQLYRNGALLEEVAAAYRTVMGLSTSFVVA